MNQLIVFLQSITSLIMAIIYLSQILKTGRTHGLPHPASNPETWGAARPGPASSCPRRMRSGHGWSAGSATFRRSPCLASRSHSAKPKRPAIGMRRALAVVGALASDLRGCSVTIQLAAWRPAADALAGRAPDLAPGALVEDHRTRERVELEHGDAGQDVDYFGLQRAAHGRMERRSSRTTAGPGAH